MALLSNLVTYLFSVRTDLGISLMTNPFMVQQPQTLVIQPAAIPLPTAKPPDPLAPPTIRAEPFLTKKPLQDSPVLSKKVPSTVIRFSSTIQKTTAMKPTTLSTVIVRPTPPAVNKSKRAVSDETANAASKSPNSTFACQIRSYSFTAHITDYDGKVCRGKVESKACFGSCDPYVTKEYGNYVNKLPVCGYEGLVEKQVELTDCDPTFGGKEKFYKYQEPESCVCKNDNGMKVDYSKIRRRNKREIKVRGLKLIY
uniref:Uncharacterized protein n=1 Tax=Romanomermis culicivorax TaxID=13658 RepID=A0A915IL88_ROMCU